MSIKTLFLNSYILNQTIALRLMQIIKKVTSIYLENYKIQNKCKYFKKINNHKFRNFNLNNLIREMIRQH